jgi:hypothetical protein
MICGSMTFAKEMVSTKKFLEDMGFEVQIPTDAHDILSGNHNHDDLEADHKYCLENNIMWKHFDFVAKSDAIIVLNHKKNSIDGYIGTATLMEIGLAYYLKKKIFLLNPLPHHSEQRWAHEVRTIQPIVINGDLDKIREYINQ